MRTCLKTEHPATRSFNTGDFSESDFDMICESDGLSEFEHQASPTSWYQVRRMDNLQVPICNTLTSSNCSNLSHCNVFISNQNLAHKRVCYTETANTILTNTRDDYNCKHIAIALVIGIATGLVSAILYDLIKSIS